MQATGNHKADALALYEWNLKLSAAFIVPLQICEIAARNGVAEALESVHGANWPWNNGFIRSLPTPKKARHYNPQIDLRSVAGRMSTTGKVVAELKFAFWERTFTAGQDARLWVPHLQTVFPGIPAGMPIPVARANAFSTLQAVRQFRNRIAHHEPIFTRNLSDEYHQLYDVISWRNPTAAAWMDRIQQVTALIANRP